MTWPNWTELSGILTAVTLACGAFGRGVVWFVQRQSRKTISAKNDELDVLRRAHIRKVRSQRLRRPPPPRRRR